MENEKEIGRGEGKAMLEKLGKIDSFKVNHIDLLTGIYVSRKDNVGEMTVTTFDLRFTRPNIEPVMDTAAIHAFEHLAATFFRNHNAYADKTIYFGPMGCRTGFYLILKGNYASRDILGAIDELCRFVIEYDGEIPGASAMDCGNYLDMNLNMAKYYAEKFYNEVVKIPEDKRFTYPV